MQNIFVNTICYIRNKTILFLNDKEFRFTFLECIVINNKIQNVCASGTPGGGGALPP